MLEKWKLFIDNKGSAGGVLIDLRKKSPITISKVACLRIQQIGFNCSMQLFVKPKTKDKDQ